MSAVRAGFQPRALDQFADADLTRLCPTQVLRRFPTSVLQAIHAEPVRPWMYSGGLENYPRVIERLSQQRELLGNSAAVVRCVRKQNELARVAGQGGYRIPPTSVDLHGAPRDGSWLVKRARSAGGLHVRRWDESTAHSELPRGWYLQQHIPGDALGAVYVAARNEVRFLGATQALFADSVPTRPWLYGGSIGPVRLTNSQFQQFTQLGEVLASEFGLIGLFGVDVICRDDQLWLLEVNPRYTASVEVLEFATGTHFVAWHVAACRGESLPSAVPPAEAIVGKRIVYATERIVIDEAQTAAWLAQNDDPLRPQIADIPAAGTIINPGEPIATVISRGDEVRETLLRLDQDTHTLRAAIT